jgi:hypothetical protein
MKLNLFQNGNAIHSLLEKMAISMMTLMILNYLKPTCIILGIKNEIVVSFVILNVDKHILLEDLSLWSIISILLLIVNF